MGKELKLRRVYLPHCTIGTLTHISLAKPLSTIELPYLSNQKDISCVPPGIYKLGKRKSSHLNQFVLYLENTDLNVTLSNENTRNYVYMHIANKVSQLLGCIAPGLKLSSSSYSVIDSAKAMEILLDLFDKGYIETLNILP